MLPEILPDDRLAPKNSYALRAIRNLRDIETVFSILDIQLPNPLPIKRTNEKGIEKEEMIQLVSNDNKAYL